MKILHVDTGRELRGGQHQLLLLLAGLTARGHQQVLLAREPTRRLAGEASGRGAPAGAGPGLPIVSGEPSLFQLWKAAPTVDLIHAHDARGHALAALVAGGKPLIVSRRVAFPIRRNRFSERKYARADHYIAISRHVREQLLAAGIPQTKVSIIYDGVALPGETLGGTALSHKAAPAAGERGGYVLAPRIDDPLKGAALLRAACAQADVELRFSSNLLEDLPRAAAFVYLSENEGLGSAILLAMARHTPVVASRVGGIPELVEDGVSGLLVENNTAAVAAALRRMLDDRELARHCAAAAYERVSERFRDDIMVRQTEQTYRAVLEARPSL